LNDYKKHRTVVINNRKTDANGEKQESDSPDLRSIEFTKQEMPTTTFLPSPTIGY